MIVGIDDMREVFFCGGFDVSQGITSLPLQGPFCIWMPVQGPVAYQVQSGFLTSDVISLNGDQVIPSSFEQVTKIRLVSLLV